MRPCSVSATDQGAATQARVMQGQPPEEKNGNRRRRSHGYDGLCIVCGRGFWAWKRHRIKKTCSVKCSHEHARLKAKEYHRERHPPGKDQTAPCAMCGTGFVRKAAVPNKIACSTTCGMHLSIKRRRERRLAAKITA